MCYNFKVKSTRGPIGTLDILTYPKEHDPSEFHTQAVPFEVGVVSDSKSDFSFYRSIVVVVA